MSSHVSVRPVLDYFNEHRPEDLEQAAREFHGDESQLESIEVPEEIADPLFGGWFLFEYRTREEDRVPLAVYLKECAKRISADERRHYEALLETQFFDFFEVADVVLDERLSLRRLRDDRPYEVRERLATRNLAVGDVLAARLAFVDGAWEFSGGAVPFPPEALPALKLTLREHPEEPPPSAKEIWHLLISPRGDRDLHSPRRAEAALDAFLTAKTRGAPPRGAEVLAWLRETKDIKKTLQRVLACTILPSNNKLHELLELLHETWNALPAHERGVNGDEASTSYKPGPVERALTNQLLSRLARDVPPGRYHSSAEHADVVRAYQECWLATPQDVLGSATPRAAVREERQESGNPNAEWEFQVVVQSLGSVREERALALFREGNEAFQRGDLRAAEQNFRALAEEEPDNYQAWGNLGLVLASRGRKDEGIQALQRAISLNPRYRLARQNMELITNVSVEELKESQFISSASVIQLGREEAAFAEWRPLVKDADVENVAALHDARAVLAWFRDRAPVRRTAVLKHLPLRVVLELNQRLAHPDPEGVEFASGRGWRFRHEDEFPTVHRLRCLLLAAGLLRVAYGRISLTEKGRRFEQRATAEQYLALLWAYFDHLSWTDLLGRRVWAWFRERAEWTRDRASLSVQRFLEKPREDGWIVLASDDEPEGSAARLSDEEREARLTRWAAKVDKEKYLWKPLAWFAMLELRQDCLGGAFSRVHAARPTALGDRLLPTLAPKMHRGVSTPESTPFPASPSEKTRSKDDGCANDPPRVS